MDFQMLNTEMLYIKLGISSSTQTEILKVF